MERLKKMPVPILPTFVGALTLSNVYAGMGYSLIRHLTMWTAALIWLVYVVKIIKHPSVCKAEYETTVPCSLYAAFTMVMMILGSYFYDYVPALGKGLWLIAIILHAFHILMFTYKNVLSKRSIHTFLPSWFVTYNGIMVSCVVGGAMNMAGMLKYIVYYGIVIYFLIIPVIIWRLTKVEIKPAVYHTMPVVLAPCSLCVVSYLNVIQNPNKILLYALYLCVLVSLGFIVVKLPQFFSFDFTPGFAGMTFPMAIGIVATNKMSAYAAANECATAAEILKQLSGIQLYLTTTIIGFVLINFLMMFLKVERR